jgi:cell wall assembly regulator SMI1
VQQRLGRALPPALRALYRIHDGQDYTASTPPMHGLFGW